MPATLPTVPSQRPNFMDGWPVPDPVLEALLVESARRFARHVSQKRSKRSETTWHEPFERAVAHVAGLPRTGSPSAWIGWVGMWLHGQGQSLPDALGIPWATAVRWSEKVHGAGSEPESAGDREPSWELASPGSAWRQALRDRQPPSGVVGGPSSLLESLELGLLIGVLGRGAKLTRRQRTAWAASALQNERMGVFDVLARTVDDARAAAASAEPWNEALSAAENHSWNSNLRDACTHEQCADDDARSVWAWIGWASRWSPHNGAGLLRLMERMGVEERLRAPIYSHAFGFNSESSGTWLHAVSGELFQKLLPRIDPLDPARPWVGRLDAFALMGAKILWNWQYPGGGRARWEDHVRCRVKSLSPSERQDVLETWWGLGFQDGWASQNPDFLEVWLEGREAPKAQERIPGATPPLRWYKGQGRWLPFGPQFAWEQIQQHDLGSKVLASWAGPDMSPHNEANPLDAQVVAGADNALWPWLLAVAAAQPFVLPYVHMPWGERSAEVIERGLRAALEADMDAADTPLPTKTSTRWRVLSDLVGRVEKAASTQGPVFPPALRSAIEALMPCWSLWEMTWNAPSPDAVGRAMARPCPAGLLEAQREVRAMLRSWGKIERWHTAGFPCSLQATQRLQQIWQAWPTTGPCGTVAAAGQTWGQWERTSQSLRALIRAYRLEQALPRAKAGGVRVQL